MRKAETVLGIIYERGRKQLPLEDVYRQLYNPELYLNSYGRIYRNDGATTKGATEETVDGMSLEKIRRIIEEIRNERYRWTPVRRTYIPKKNGNKRPLGMPSWSDKLLQDVIKSMLEAYYEPQFSDTSHGFRPNRGCHTALATIKKVWHGVKWFIEGDIKGCFDNIDKPSLLNILRKRIHDNRFMRLIENLLNAGYLEDWKYHPTLSGVPQGGICSPILANIYLDQLDQYVEKELLPKYTKGKKRANNPEYDRLSNQAYQYRKKGLVKEAIKLEKERRLIPSNNPYDPNYSRLYYIRYADDFLLGFVGPREEALDIKEAIKAFLKQTLKLELSAEKTLITHTSKGRAQFLGYEICISQCNTKITSRKRSINGGIALRMPSKFPMEKARYYMKNDRPTHKRERVHDSDYGILCQYQSEYRGYIQHYQLADNIAKLSVLHGTMRYSLLKTLANKYKSTVAKMVKKYATKVMTPYGPRKCLEVVVAREGEKPLIARFGGIPLRTNKEAVISDQPIIRARFGRNELLKRLLRDTCEICESKDNIEVHHVRKLADLHRKGRKARPDWAKLMASRRRKTLVVCRSCHRKIHNGQPLNNVVERVTGEPYDAKVSRTVRRGDDGKGV